jgi:hypothetical protein
LARLCTPLGLSVVTIVGKEDPWSIFNHMSIVDIFATNATLGGMGENDRWFVHISQVWQEDETRNDKSHAMRH